MITPNEEIKLKEEVAKAYKIYLKNFEAGDMKAIETSCSFPLSFDADGEVKSFNQFPIDVTAMKETTGYYQSLNSDIEVITVLQTKAHIILRKALRVKQDGTPIESVSGFYIWVKLDGLWKMKFASAITLQQN